MKICSQLLALCVFRPNVWGATAFFSQAPTALMPKGRSKDVLVSPSFSYLGSLSSPGVSQKPEYGYTFPQPSTFPEPSTFSEPSTFPQPSTQSFSISDRVTLNTPEVASPKYASMVPPEPAPAEMKPMKDIKNAWDTLSPITVQGGSLRTWSFRTDAIERVQVMLKTEGRPLRANIELWRGPDNTPVKMDIYNEDGSTRPFNAIIETPRGQNAIAIRNTGQIEFPLAACIAADVADATGKTSLGLSDLSNELARIGTPKVIQGGALTTYPFDSTVGSVQILLKTDGRPLNARIELLQGPNNNKQVIELYTENGDERPFFAVIETPGSGNVVRIVNTATMEFPLTARVEPYMMEIIEDDEDGGFFVLDGQW